MNKRDTVEGFLLGKFDSISPFNPGKSSFLEKYKSNNFGFSSIAFALYSNGHNFRGESTKNKYGLVYNDGENIFSIGYFRKEMDTIDNDGYLFFVAPTGKDAISKVKEIIDCLSKADLPIQGFYIRYLTLSKYVESIKLGALPIKEFPWHPEAPEEDETFTNSLIKIDDVLKVENDSLTVKTINGLSRNSKKKIRYAFSRFENFLKRKSSEYVLTPLTQGNSKIALSIIKSHFIMLKELGKNIGSTAEDHFNAVDLKMLENPHCKGYIGMLDEIPVSVFIGESISHDTFALYTPFTVRDPKIIGHILTSGEADSIGVSAMPTYAYVKLLAEIKKIGFEYVDLGGSEIADLNKFKRQLGGKSNSSYWAYFSK